MPQPRVMLLGAAGQVGQALQNYLATTKPQTDWDLCVFSRAECNVTNPAMLREAIQSTKPDLVINTSGLTNVDQAEQDKNLAMATNFHAVAQMAAQCSALDIPLIHLSTDYVFDGRKGTPYLPDDQMNPLNYYGASKMMGEEALRHEHPWHVILRVSSVFSAFRRNILSVALKMADEMDDLRIVTDLVSTPTYAPDVAAALTTIGAALLDGKVDGYGTFHYCGTPAASRYDFVEAALKAYEPYSDRHPRLIATVCAEFAEHAPRPAYSALDCAKIKAVYGIEQKDWREGLRDALEHLHNAERRPRV